MTVVELVDHLVDVHSEEDSVCNTVGSAAFHIGGGRMGSQFEEDHRHEEGDKGIWSSAVAGKDFNLVFQQGAKS